MIEQRTQRLADFVAWADQHITGDEKGQAQIFLDRLFQAFGHKGCIEVGGTPEFRIRKEPREEPRASARAVIGSRADVLKAGGVAFADYVWKPYVLIEMKKRGEDLHRHYRQAFDYWVQLVPGRPRYVVLCNFDEFWVYDFETQMDTPVDQVALAELPERFGPLAFLFPSHDRPIFGNDHERVTRDAADKLAMCFNKLIPRYPRDLAQRFTLQMLVALFAEDIGLLEKYFVVRLLDECQAPTDSYDLLGGLFEAMNSPNRAAGGRYKGVDYFNGGLFEQPARLELHDDELNQLRQSAKSDWSKVRPEIFGTLFEHSLESGERHAYGGHFTHPTDIMKIVGPTIVEPWRSVIENASTLTQLEKLRHRMLNYRVLDPACGSGNFLYIAYRELKRLEARLFERIAERKKVEKGQRQLGFVNTSQFFGIDINPFAVEIAKVTMMIARKLAIDELHIHEPALPLDRLDDNFIAGDALITPVAQDGRPVPTMLFAELEQDPWKTARIIPTAWPKVDVIIGNPPFLGAKLLKPQRGTDYVNAVRKTYSEVPGMADYCVYWIRRTHDHLPECTAADPLAGRAGLVGTQNIRNNKSREGGLDYVVKRGTIIEAVDNQPWSGEANVHVSIVNWVKHAPLVPLPDPDVDRDGSDQKRAPRSRDLQVARSQQSRARQEAAGILSLPDLLIPPIRRLWQKVNAPPERAKIRKRADTPAAKEYELIVRECAFINSALSLEADLAGARSLRCNQVPQRAFRGFEPGNLKFLLTPSQAKSIVAQDAQSHAVLHPFLTGRELVTGDGKPLRYVIDFQRLSLIEAMESKAAFRHVETHVLPQMQRIASSLPDRRPEETTAEDAALADRIKKRQLVPRLENWWQLRRCVPETAAALRELTRYIVCPLVTKRPVFVFMDSSVYPNNKTAPFMLEDDYSFSILQSGAHWAWFVARCAKLTERFSYSPTYVFDTFPWPQSPNRKQVRAVAEAGREVRRVRGEALGKIKGGLRAVYRTLELPGKNPLKDAHAALDTAVLDAYGFSPDADLLQQLLDLNLAVADRIDKGDLVTAPGIPPDYPTPEDLITADCIRPQG